MTRSLPDLCDEFPGDLLVGNQVGRETYPDLDAIIVQFSYHFAR